MIIYKTTEVLISEEIIKVENSLTQVAANHPGLLCLSHIGDF